MNNQKIPVVFTIDRNYLMPLSVTLVSLFTNNMNEELSVYVLYNDFETADKKKIQSIGDQFNRRIELININDDQFKNFKTGFHFSKAIFFRLLIPELFDGKYEKVLYIDSDALVLQDISPLFQIDFKDNYLAAVENFTFNDYKRLGLNPEFRYFASGTLLFNIPKWNKDKISQKIFEYLSLSTDIKMPDQDALNVVINGNWKHLPLSYGIETIWVKSRKEQKSKFLLYKTFIDNPIIIHFSGSVKPWHYLDKKPYKKEFWRYLQQTPFSEYKFQDITLKNIIEKLLPEPITAFLKRRIISKLKKL